MQDQIQKDMSTNPQTGLPPIGQSSMPQDVQASEQDQGDQSYNNYCEAFVEQQAYGKQGLFPTAAAAIDYYSQNGMAYSGTDGIQPGDLVYFAPDASNNNEGHTGIYSGNGKFISATGSGVTEYTLDQWQKDTGQKLVGYVPPPNSSNDTQSASPRSGQQQSEASPAN